MMCISLFSYGRPVVVRCKGVQLGMGWVGLGQLFGGLGWAGSMKIDPRTTLRLLSILTTRPIHRSCAVSRNASMPVI